MRAHHPGTFRDMHSVEDLVLNEPTKAIQIITPILDYILVLVIAYMLLSRLSISSDYLSSGDMCPSVDYAQSAVASIDTSLFYYYKATLHFYCSIEDSFWKLILDSWVRTIIAESDNMLLLVTTLPQALIFQFAIMVFVVP